jgi:hypothetical protein
MADATGGRDFGEHLRFDELWRVEHPGLLAEVKRVL